MTTKAQLRKAALALPETDEGTHGGMTSFSVRGEEFASVTEDGRVLLRLCDEEAASVPSEHPTGERVIRAGRPIGMRIPLADVDGMALNALVRSSWRHRAPKRLAASLEAAERADPAGGDLPASIGRPAMRALHGAGVTTLDQVAARGEAELLALHGVGPKAIRILNEAVESRSR